MKRNIAVGAFVVATLVWMPSLAATYESSFIEDLPELTRSKEDKAMLEWTREDLNLLSYDKLHIPQPAIILSDKNKYKGIQPDQMKHFADRVDAIATHRFEDIIDVTEEVGPGTIVMNMAVTEVIMKKKRGLMAFTPTGALLHAATSNTKYEDLEQFAEKIQLKEANLEVELVDGGTGELLAVRVLEVEGKQKDRDEQSWWALRKEIDGVFDRFYRSYASSLDLALQEARAQAELQAAERMAAEAAAMEEAPAQ
jgi:hypothetical protein